MRYSPIINPESENWNYELSARDFEKLVSGKRPDTEAASRMALIVSKPDVNGQGLIIGIAPDEDGEGVRAEYKTVYVNGESQGVVLHKLWWKAYDPPANNVSADDAKAGLIMFMNVLAGLNLPE